MGSPYSKAYPLFPILLDKMRPKHFIGMKIRTLMKQIQIKLTQIRCLHFKSPSVFPPLLLRYKYRLDFPDIGCVFIDGTVRREPPGTRYIDS